MKIEGHGKSADLINASIDPFTVNVGPTAVHLRRAKGKVPYSIPAEGSVPPVEDRSSKIEVVVGNFSHEDGSADDRGDAPRNSRGRVVAPSDDLAAAVLARVQIEVAQRDCRRALARLDSSDRTQVQIARTLRISQPSLSKALKIAREEPPIPEGFSGAGPLEICQRYALGQIDREHLIDELVRWPYTPMVDSELYEDFAPTPGPGSWLEVQDAADQGLIDGELYDEIARRK